MLSKEQQLELMERLGLEKDASVDEAIYKLSIVLEKICKKLGLTMDYLKDEIRDDTRLKKSGNSK